MASMYQLPSVRVLYHQKAGTRIILLSTPPGNIASLLLRFWEFFVWLGFFNWHKYLFSGPEENSLSLSFLDSVEDSWKDWDLGSIPHQLMGSV